MSDSEFYLKLFKKVENLKDSNNVDVGSELNKVLDELNARSQSFRELENVNELILLICDILQPSGNEHLLLKFYHFIYTLRSKEQVNISNECIQKLVDYSLRSLTVCREWALLEILNVLSVLLYENVGILSKYWDLLVGADGFLIRTVKRCQHDTESHLGTLKCLQNICLRKNTDPYLTEDHLIPCFTAFYDTLKETLNSPYDPKNILRTKTLLAALYGLKNIIIGWKHVPSNNVGELLGIMKCLISFGLKDAESPLKFSRLYPISIDVVLPQATTSKSVNTNSFSMEKVQHQTSSKRKNRKKRQNTGKKIEKNTADNENDEKETKTEGKLENLNISYDSGGSNYTFNRLPWMYSSSSDSEYSDSERSHAAKINHYQAKVRYCSYKVMQAINWATDKKIMFGYLTSLVPDYPTQYDKFKDDNSALWTILKDTSPQVRGAALGFLTEILDGTKIYLAMADERNSARATTSFIPKSLILAGTIRELHRCLSLALSKEVSSALLAQILKCFSILIDNCSYNRLGEDLLEGLLSEMEKVLQNKDVQVQVACWTLLGSLTRIDKPIRNLELFFFQGNVTATCPASKICWLISYSHSLITQKDERRIPTPILLEILQVLTSFTSNFYSKIKDDPSVIMEIITICVTDSDNSIQFHGVKVFEALCKCFLDERSNENDLDEEKKSANIALSLEMWTKMFNGPFPSLLQHPSNHSIRALGCDCLSNIGNEVFQLLPRHFQVLSVSVLLGLVNDDNANVRGAAVRCLGIYTLYSSMNDTVTFLMDVGDVIKQLLDDSNYNTCLKASWALGNLSDALLIKREEILDVFPSLFVCSLGTSALKASKTQDNIKIRANIVRAIGNLLNYIPGNSLENSSMQNFINDSVKLLISCLGKSMMKVQWNVCYALGMVLQNKELVASNIFKLEDVFSVLVKTVNSSKNFKVKINAITTLCSLKERDPYGDSFYSIWSCLLDALVVTEESVDYREINHRDSLCIQLCLSLSHMTSLLTPSDIAILNDFIVNYQELISKLITKYNTLIPDDKVEILKANKTCFENFKHSYSKGDDSGCILILENFYITLLSQI